MQSFARRRLNIIEFPNLSFSEIATYSARAIMSEQIELIVLLEELRSSMDYQLF